MLGFGLIEFSNHKLFIFPLMMITFVFLYKLGEYDKKWDEDR